MKKILLFVMGAMMSMASFAQEEDVTYLIKNAGFDQDLTFQADGTMKEAVTTNTSLSDRSWAYICADSTVYARPKSTSVQQRTDGRSKLDAVNGFHARVQGWKLEGVTFPKCEWMYYGVVPYGLPSDAVLIADDGSGTLIVPEKPEADNGDENKGALYMRAGWTNSCSYKQEVTLPCAVYRLEYWTINVNPNTSATAEDLSKITCRKDVFKDESGTGLNAKEWTKHEFEFTPTSRFTMEFGYKSANQTSNNNPWVCLDGIKLYKIGEADRDDINRADINDMIADCQELAGQATSAGFAALATYIGEYEFNLEDSLGLDGDDLERAVRNATAHMNLIREALAEMSAIDNILAKMDALLASTDYAGKTEFEAAYQKILGYKETVPAPEEITEAILTNILGAVAEANAAIKAYYMSQQDTASEDNPADFTFFIQHPWFINDDAEPTFVDDVWVFPNADSYTEGSASSPDLNSEGWEITGASGGDQRLNWQRGRSCWNAWNNNFTTTVAVGQTIEDLPNGYYTVAADMTTQSGCATNQHVYAETSAEKKISAQTLTIEGWDDNEWQTVSMTAAEKVLVVDGKLTIGAEGTGSGSGAAGWFLVTNFKLNFVGKASEEVIAAAIKNSFDAKILAAEEMAAKMHFAADKKALNDSIDMVKGAADKDAYLNAISVLTAAMAAAETSEAKYLEYLPEDETIIEGKTLREVKTKLAETDTENYPAYGEAKPIAQFAYDYVMGWIACDTATYTAMDATVDLLKNYVNTYIPVYQEAAEVAAAAKETGKNALQAVMNDQKNLLVGEMQTAGTINTLITQLRSVMDAVKKQNIYDDATATDYTAYIKNPKAEAEDGWEFERGNGNNNTNSGQWFDGSSTRYFDSYHSEDKTDAETGETTHIGLEGYKATQVVNDLPNGTYAVGVYTRTPAEGAYVFAGTSFVEIPLDYYTDESTGEPAIASDTHGPIWEAAKEAMDAGTATEEEINIYNAHSGNGYGWKHQIIPDIVVTDHTLTIGTMCGVEGTTEKVFAGNWYSVGGWTLTLTAMGDNTGWGGPIASGIDTVKTTVAIEGIYNLTGVKMNKLQRGLNIVIRNGKAVKVIVK